tara:strand:+ start:2943 stop:3260 length:318 start_codon:yes stop_codon:yes gene_type:complete
MGRDEFSKCEQPIAWRRPSGGARGMLVSAMIMLPMIMFVMVVLRPLLPPPMTTTPHSLSGAAERRASDPFSCYRKALKIGRDLGFLAKPVLVEEVSFWRISFVVI